ncbi:MAG TPA: hypothetical protein VK667_12800 [Ktedonobacteraceae bacterium]|nr:hypothetical protein [Ktedonobacteraceae bacterium]
MSYRATCVAYDPLEYFLEKSTGTPYLCVSDVVLRENRSPKEIFAELIRLATNSKWSHSALMYLISDPKKGFNNTFLVEALTKGIHLTSWRNEVVPYEQFTVGIKRPHLDWYIETPYEKAKHDAHDPEDTHGIDYLRHVRGIALDQINGLFDHKVVNELTALYVERVARKHLSAVPQVAQAADAVATLFKKWDTSDKSKTNLARFVCSGLVQYSFFAALRIRIINDLEVPENREAALSNLSNMSCIIFREDPDHVIDTYIRRVQAGELNLADPMPDDVQDILKTATPADFNNSNKLQWRYVIRKGVVWQIDEVTGDYTPQTEDEAAVLELTDPEHRN